MEAPASTHRSQILGRSSMFRFFRRLVRKKSHSKRTDKGLARGRACSSKEQGAVALRTGHQGQMERKEPKVPSMLPGTLGVAAPKGSQKDLSYLGMGDTSTQTLASTQTLQVLAQDKEVRSVLSSRSQDSLPEKEKEGEVKNEATEQASRQTEVTGRNLTNFPFPFKEGVPREKEKREEEEVEEEDNVFNLCVPDIVTLQPSLQRIFRSTDTVGFMESELKRLLAVKRESRLWKMGSKEGRELLAQPEITLEEAGIVNGQHLLLEEMDEMGNWPPE
ncbi:PREDICTED: gametogenetin-binding protein 1-like [Elephantulus edwardii]|uniref:gametogenetin-binding protein 1-like n=1 Tax=Elephantulus edwardii TaxID=28737 RepID=UPI0003F0F2E1|nr:PREDICTED: gametogenetin-binding protein 1-like [Elephantulus edwardii]